MLTKRAGLLLLIFLSLHTGLLAIPLYKNQWPPSIFPDFPSGKVKKITETSYQIKNGENGYTKKNHSVVYKYNNKGYLKTVEYYNANDTQTSTLEYLYKDGQLFQKIEKFPNIKYPYTENFEITNKGLVASVEKHFTNGRYGWRYVNTYNSKGKIIKTDKYDKFWNWKLIFSKTFSYNNTGLLYLDESFGMDSKAIEKNEYFYNKKDQIEKSIKYNSAGEIVAKIKNIYDEHGNYLRREFIDRNGDTFAVFTYSRKYDNFDNWTTSVMGREYKGNDSVYIIPESLIIREIEYFE